MAAPFVTIGVAGMAVSQTHLDGDPELEAVGPGWSTPPADVEAMRSAAADDPARSDPSRSPLSSPPTRSDGSPSPSTPSPSTRPPSATPSSKTFPPVDGCTATAPEDDTANGELDSDSLCEIGNGHALRPDAAAAFVALDEAYADATGASLVACVTDSYRSYDQQVELSEEKPGLAAEPGTSNHGWGTAVDIGCGAELFTGALHEWLITHGTEYGWHNPRWARSDGVRPEPWHWEYDPDLLR
ncbi:D-alanyl-D-alanine carboxypeptidase-like protein [Haloactinopolyspora alba]|uniref:D-alanyl-D-alanine carboxypeptidase-like protein n=1 Tax=Haloactinopolyspora alba TaxID=648780 RepID=A0A2P8DJX4_9ACTN|nr:M15 family metallopeptidase [Haloactinopolyspora alba]PSK97525.1 D-alanyl-D-alanine carboxypeptidase-like protein [Haloactinopolyspora alba]